jgi:8-oxo-dGTP pyrophosphatase MutT (NUDIX family)
MTTPVPIRPASTVVVIRPGAGDVPFEVLLVRRNDHIAFMAGAYVFPGGRVDDADRLADPQRVADGLGDVSRFADLTAADEAVFRVAALRELLEEAGVLLGTRDGAPVTADDAAAARARLEAGESMADIAAGTGLRLSLDAIVPFAHWVTPAIEIRRYDTRFFLARMPEGQHATHDAGETTALEWWSPADAVERCRRGEIMLPPPTWTTLAQIGRCRSVDEAWAWARARRIWRVEPHFTRGEEASVIRLPGDPLFPAPEDWEAPEETRFVLEEGRGWRPVRG